MSVGIVSVNTCGSVLKSLKCLVDLMFNAKVQLQLNDVQSETKLRDKAM